MADRDSDHRARATSEAADQAARSRAKQKARQTMKDYKSVVHLKALIDAKPAPSVQGASIKTLRTVADELGVPKFTTVRELRNYLQQLQEIAAGSHSDRSQESDAEGDKMQALNGSDPAIQAMAAKNAAAGKHERSEQGKGAKTASARAAVQTAQPRAPATRPNTADAQPLPPAAAGAERQTQLDRVLELRENNANLQKDLEAAKAQLAEAEAARQAAEKAAADATARVKAYAHAQTLNAKWAHRPYMTVDHAGLATDEVMEDGAADDGDDEDADGYGNGLYGPFADDCPEEKKPVSYRFESLLQEGSNIVGEDGNIADEAIACFTKSLHPVPHIIHYDPRTLAPFRDTYLQGKEDVETTIDRAVSIINTPGVNNISVFTKIANARLPLRTRYIEELVPSLMELIPGRENADSIYILTRIKDGVKATFGLTALGDPDILLPGEEDLIASLVKSDATIGSNRTQAERTDKQVNPPGVREKQGSGGGAGAQADSPSGPPPSKPLGLGLDKIVGNPFQPLAIPSDEPAAAAPAAGAGTSSSKPGDRFTVRTFTGEPDKYIKSMSAWFDVYVRYCQRRGDDPFTCLCFATAGEAQTWALAYQQSWEKQKKRPSLDKLRADFLTQWDNPFSYTQEDVTDRLLRGECKQTGSVQQYVAAFRLLMQYAPDMDQLTKISFFKNGLSSALRQKVNFRPDGSPWTELDALINYTVSQGITSQTARAPRPSLSALSAPPQAKKARRDNASGSGSAGGSGSGGAGGSGGYGGGRMANFGAGRGGRGNNPAGQHRGGRNGPALGHAGSRGPRNDNRGGYGGAPPRGGTGPYRGGTGPHRGGGRGGQYTQAQVNRMLAQAADQAADRAVARMQANQ